MEHAYPPGSRDGFAAALDTELALRVRSLSEPQHLSSDCCGSTRSSIVEACLWAACGAVIWVATLAWFG
jgi:hypothetical protein